MNLGNIVLLLTIMVVFIGCANTSLSVSSTESENLTCEVLKTTIFEANNFLNDNMSLNSVILILNVSVEAPQVADLLINNLITLVHNEDKFRFIDRQRHGIEQIEHSFQTAGVADDGVAVQIANFYGASSVLICKVFTFEKQLKFNIRTFEVKTSIVPGEAYGTLEKKAVTLHGEFSKLIGKENNVIAFVKDCTKLIKKENVPITQTKNTSTLKNGYAIGDIGPAGGLIFFDKGVFSDGWRYLEVAPLSVEFVAEWGHYGKYINGTETSVGTGKRNTELIVAALNELGEIDKAAQLSASISINGYSDWFIPSKEELNLIYQNLIMSNITKSFKADWYWSSSQRSYINVWGQNFSDGKKFFIWNNNLEYVRSIRAF